MSRPSAGGRRSVRSPAGARPAFRPELAANAYKMCGHVPRLHQWLQGRDIYPISVEISLTSRCNNDCCWCSTKAKGVERGRHLPRALLRKFVSDIREMGVRSVVISGSGEQTLHPGFAAFLGSLGRRDIAAGVNTNGSRLPGPVQSAIVGRATWVRISLDAASAATRRRVHGVDDLGRVRQAIRGLVALRRRTGSHAVIGTQMVVCRENQGEIEATARLSRALGADYHQIKPVSFFDHYPASGGSRAEMAQWSKRAGRTASELSGNGFKVIVRHDQFTEQVEGGAAGGRARGGPCLATFSPYVEADGSVWYCVDRKGHAGYLLGNLREESLKRIWHGRRRKEVLAYVRDTACGTACRNSPLNDFLREVRSPSRFHDFL